MNFNNLVNQGTPKYDVSEDGLVVTKHFVDADGKIVGGPVTYLSAQVASQITQVQAQLTELQLIQSKFKV